MADYGEKVRLVVLGALCAWVPNACTMYCSQRHEARETRVERKLAAIRAYAAACTRLANAGTEVVSWEKRQRLAAEGGFAAEPHARDYLVARRDQVYGSFWDAAAEKAAADAAVEALFGLDLDEQEASGGEKTGFEGAVSELRERCKEITTQLVTAVQ